MATATIALRTRPRPSLGPALGRVPFPFGTIVLSALLHVVAIGAVVVGLAAWHESQPKAYVVNLVPAIAAVGRPQGRASVPTPTQPPRTSEVTPPTPKAVARELPQREAPKPTTKELPQREARASLPEMPARSIPRDSPSLPDRTLPSRPTVLPRPGDKELPATAPARSAVDIGPAPKRETAPAAAPAPAPAPLGQVAGSTAGAGTVTLSVSDFPYAWYIQAIHRKIQERWEGRAIDGRQPEVYFEIGGDGQLRSVDVHTTSGNPAYDQLAVRAIRDANPFPPLPSGFGKPSLKVGLQFVYDARAR